MASKANRLTLTAVSTVLATGQAAALPPHQPPEARLPYEGTLMLTQADSENRFIEAYTASRYDYDDAALLADFWGQPTPWDAKLKIGRLLLDGQGACVQQALQQASQRAQDPEAQRIDAFFDLQALQLVSQRAQDPEAQRIDAFFDGPFTDDDAALLADFWGQPTPWDAKLKIGRLLLDGQRAYVQQALQQASQRAQDPEAQRIDAFVDGPFTYDDAALLADFWGTPSPWDAKLKIGGLLLDGQGARVEAALGNARSWKAYVASPYGYNDAEVLSGLWGLPSPWDAKLKIGRLLLAGDEAWLQQALHAAR